MLDSHFTVALKYLALEVAEIAGAVFDMPA
jgi:hypothetical protein